MKSRASENPTASIARRPRCIGHKLSLADFGRLLSHLRTASYSETSAWARDALGVRLSINQLHRLAQSIPELIQKHAGHPRKLALFSEDELHRIQQWLRSSSLHCVQARVLVEFGIRVSIGVLSAYRQKNSVPETPAEVARN